jgi:hypothetical protein
LPPVGLGATVVGAGAHPAVEVTRTICVRYLVEVEYTGMTLVERTAAVVVVVWVTVWDDVRRSCGLGGTKSIPGHRFSRPHSWQW